MTRTIRPGKDVLVVEGPDDGAFANALVKKELAIDLAALRLVKTRDEGGGDAWALGEFDRLIGEAFLDARVGLVLDRDVETNDKWPRVQARLRKLGHEIDQPTRAGAIVGQFGIWMWPDNVSHGDLEHVVEALIPPSPLLAYARDASRIARTERAAEYREADERKATLKVRSIWREARTAGGYGHLVRELDLANSEAATAFLAWFERLFLTE